ncbi:MAG: TGS domain-containing protein [Chloroflexi bacterium]|nr:TGS domain-containing protein [Chloroflexota bacterium]
MPTNLPPEAQEAERRYRAAQSVEERIQALEEWLRYIPKHKGTDKLRADLRQRLSKLQGAAKGPKTLSKHESSFRIDREGAGQVAVVGAPNVGKSALVARLTKATPEVSPAPFTTWEPTPGMMPIEDIQVQLIDTPPLHSDYIEPELIELIRRADLILLVVDVRTDPLGQLEASDALLQERGIVMRRPAAEDADEEDDAEAPAGGRRVVYRPVVVVANKYDDESADDEWEIFCALLDDDWPIVPVSAETGRNLERLKQEVFRRLEIVRIYAKPPGKPPDMERPYVLPEGSTVEELAAKVHRDFYENLTAARVWGTGVFDGQMVGRDHVLHDGDIVELHM